MRPSKWLIVVPLVSGAIALTVPAVAATPQAALMSLNAEVAFGSALVSDPQTASWGQPQSPLAVASRATVDDGVGNVLQAYGTASATWASSNAGSVIFTNYGWTLSGPGTSFFVSLELSQPDWQYTFEARDAENTLAVNYTTTGSGNLFGLPGWEISVVGGPQGVQVAGLVQGASIPSASGTFVADLTAGNQYSIFLGNRANLAGSSLPFSGSMSGEFDWQISAVPELPAASLLLAGLMLLGWRRGKILGQQLTRQLASSRW